MFPGHSDSSGYWGSLEPEVIGGFLPPPGLAMSCQMITCPLSVVGEGSSTAPRVPSYRREWQSSPTIHHWGGAQAALSETTPFWSLLQKLSEGLLAAGPLREPRNLPSSCQSLCPLLNQTPGITPALGSPSGPPTTLPSTEGITMEGAWRRQDCGLSSGT